MNEITVFCPLYNKNINGDECYCTNEYASGMFPPDELPDYANADYVEENSEICMNCKYCQTPADFTQTNKKLKESQ